MTPEGWRELQLLDALEEGAALSQRRLADRVGIALGLTNLYLKRLIRDGCIRIVTLPSNRVQYVLTPRGAARKSRLSLQFMRYSLDVFSAGRRRVQLRLEGHVGRGTRVAIYGTGAVAEMAFLLLRQAGVKPVAILDDAAGREFLGMRVQPVADHDDISYDVLIVALLEKTRAAVRTLTAAGVPRQKLLLLQ